MSREKEVQKQLEVLALEVKALEVEVGRSLTRLEYNAIMNEIRINPRLSVRDAYSKLWELPLS